jgi:hypothetical protein
VLHLDLLKDDLNALIAVKHVSPIAEVKNPNESWSIEAPTK